jgi:starch synthase
MLQHCYAFKNLSDIPTVFTIHNAQYQGWMGWDKSHYLPAWDTWKGGLLEWNNTINPLAAAVKSAWKVTTVSPSYLGELTYMANGLESLFEYEKGKTIGILNGIDTDVWDPNADNFIAKNYDAEKVERESLKIKKRSAGSLGWMSKNLCLHLSEGWLEKRLPTCCLIVSALLSTSIMAIAIFWCLALANHT